MLRCALAAVAPQQAAAVAMPLLPPAARRDTCRDAKRQELS